MKFDEKKHAKLIKEFIDICLNKENVLFIKMPDCADQNDWDLVEKLGITMREKHKNLNKDLPRYPFIVIPSDYVDNMDIEILTKLINGLKE